MDVMTNQVVRPGRECRECGEDRRDLMVNSCRLEDGHDKICKPCNRPSAAARSTKWRLANLYGISHDEWVALLASQDGRCPVCTCEFSGLTSRDICVDHDHATGDVRGILCRSCNRALGFVDDSPANLRRAALYLERSAKPAGRRERE